jgi:hypothetical protein
MDKLDVGLHVDPTPTGAQAMDRRYAVSEGWFPGKKGGVGDDAMMDLRIHTGNILGGIGDPGTWDKPADALYALKSAAYEQGLPDLERDLDLLGEGSLASTIVSTGSARDKAVAEMAAIRETLKAHDIDTLSYQNFEEGADAAVDAAVNSPENLAREAAELDRAAQLRSQSDAAYAAGDDFLGEQLDLDATDIEDGLEIARDEIRDEALRNNQSYIVLDPGNVRSADAAFQKDMIGKPDMMGYSTVPYLAGLSGLGATGAVIASQSPSESLSQGWEALKGLPEMIYNDVLSASEGIDYGLTGNRRDYGQVDFNEETPLGNALAQDIGEYIGGIKPIPFSDYTVGEGISDIADWWGGLDLSERERAGFEGGALMASMIGLPGKKTVVTPTVDTRLGKQTAAANAKSLDNQATRVREALAEEGGYETVAEDVVDLQSLPVLSRSDLEGAVLMPTAGDRTMHARLKKSGGIDVDADLQGGPGYGALYGDWESTADIANSYQNKVQQVAEAAGTDKVTAPCACLPRTSQRCLRRWPCNRCRRSSTLALGSTRSWSMRSTAPLQSRAGRSGPTPTSPASSHQTLRLSSPNAGRRQSTRVKRCSVRWVRLPTGTPVSHW